jgi:hypothetical protein
MHSGNYLSETLRREQDLGSSQGGLPRHLFGGDEQRFNSNNDHLLGHANPSSYQNSTTLSSSQNVQQQQQVPAASLPDLVSSRMGATQNTNLSASIDSSSSHLPVQIHEPTLPTFIHHTSIGSDTLQSSGYPEDGADHSAQVVHEGKPIYATGIMGGNVSRGYVPVRANQMNRGK